MHPILVVDDEQAIAMLIRRILTDAGYRCEAVTDSIKAADLLEKKQYDLVLLDIMMPQIDGYDLLNYIRPTGTPCIFITAKAAVEDRVRGLHSGADDYIVKPFAMEELLARLRIWSRRTVSLEDPGELCFGDLSYRPSVRQLSGPAGKEVLPKRLAQLIELLLRNAEVPITRNVIFNRIWGPDAEVTDAVIDTYIHLTRQRLANLQSAVKIQNSRGTGYQLSYEREL